MSIDNIIKHIIDHHNQVENAERKRYWHQKLVATDSQEAREIASTLEKVLDPKNANHHIGDFYRKSGMKIALDRNSSESTNLLKVINTIVQGLKNSDTEGNLTARGKDLIILSHGDDNQAELLQYKQIYGDQKERDRSLAEMDLPEEFEVKAMAVSILAETNGDVKLAKDILSVSGLKIIKKLTKS